MKRTCHFDDICIIGCTRNYKNDNIQCNHWWKIRQNNDLSVSVCDKFCVLMTMYESEGMDWCCSALPIYRGHFSPHNSRKTPIARPLGRGMGVFREFEVWPKFYLRSCCTWAISCYVVPWYIDSLYSILLANSYPRDNINMSVGHITQIICNDQLTRPVLNPKRDIQFNHWIYDSDFFLDWS